MRIMAYQLETKMLESIQKRARVLNIIFGGNRVQTMPSLQERRHHLTEHFFRQSFVAYTNCLYDLIPAKRNIDVTNRFRVAEQHTIPCARTENHKNSKNVYGLTHYIL